MGRTVFIDKDVVSSQLNSLSTNQFSFGFLCGQSTRSERDYIHYIIDGITSKQTDIDSFFASSPTNKDSTNNELWAKIIEITSSLCAGVTIIGFYCRAKADALKSTNFTLKVRRLFEILQTALKTYSPWSLTQSSHRILLQSETGSGANKWLVKTMDMSSDNVQFRPVEMKTYDSSTSSMWCMTTTIPLQFNVWLNPININDEKNIKLIENQFEEQWKQYIDSLKESLLLMDNRLVPLDNFKLPTRSSSDSVDIQWLSSIDSSSISTDTINDSRLCYKFDGGVSLRLFTCHSDTSGNDIRQYFLEDLFRSMLIRLNLALINSGSLDDQTTSLNKIVLPRRVYINRPVFISAYQLVHETLPMVVESFQENFKINSILEDDLEAAEEFPPEITKDERDKQFNSNINKKETNSNNRLGFYRNLVAVIEQYVGRGNGTLTLLLVSTLILLVSIMIRLFT